MRVQKALPTFAGGARNCCTCSRKMLAAPDTTNKQQPTGNVQQPTTSNHLQSTTGPLGATVAQIKRK